MFSTDDIQIKNINHLGLVAGIIDDIGLAKIINEVIGEDPRELITSGQVVKGMILKMGYLLMRYLFRSCYHQMG